MGGLMEDVWPGQRVRDLGYPFPLAVTLVEQGEWLRTAGRPENADPLLAEARDVFGRLGAVPWLENGARHGTAGRLPRCYPSRRYGRSSRTIAITVSRQSAARWLATSRAMGLAIGDRARSVAPHALSGG